MADSGETVRTDGGGPCVAPIDAGPCFPQLTELEFKNGGFESGGFAPGWQGPADPPFYAFIACEAARTGRFGLKFEDNGLGVPRVFQPIEVNSSHWGRMATAAVFVRAISFPSLRLALGAFRQNRTRLDVKTTVSQTLGAWERLEVTLEIPTEAELLEVEVTSGVPEGSGVAYIDDGYFCFEGQCSNVCL